MIPPSPTPAAGPVRGRLSWWLVLAGVLIPCIYLPILTTRFDFIDDGTYVYPTDKQTLGEHVQQICDRTADLFHTLGPFQPTFFVHVELQGTLFQGNPLGWRMLHQLWACLSGVLLVWLMWELGIRPGAAVLAAALALWNPYRGEVWIQLRLAEGNTFPFLMLALVLAVRAGRSSRPWLFDVAGAACVLCALGFKNTFAAVVPAQILLRLLAGGLPWKAALRRHWRGAVVLLLPLTMPIVHFILFKMQWRPGHVETFGPTWAQAWRLVRAHQGAVSIDFMAAGLVLAIIALAVARWRERGEANTAVESTAEPSFWSRYRLPLLAGLALLFFGSAIYLPIPGVAGRYTLPAAWGLDLWVAVLLSALADAKPSIVRRVAFAAFGAGLIAVAVANLGKQQDFAARVGLLWEALEIVERDAPPGAAFVWHDGPDLGYGEGMHFYYHLHSRGRPDLTFIPWQPVSKVIRSGPSDAAPVLCVSGVNQPPDDAGWQLIRQMRARTLVGRKYLNLYLFARGSAMPE